MKQKILKFTAVLLASAMFFAQTKVSLAAETVSQIIQEEMVENYRTDIPSDFMMAYEETYVPSLSKAYIADRPGRVVYPASTHAVQKSPVKVSGGSARDTTVTMDVATISDNSWPWWGKALVITGGIIVTGLIVYYAIDNSGRNTSGDDSSEHLNVNVTGTGNHININHDSPTTTHGY
jgi:hypothetical protein